MKPARKQPRTGHGKLPTGIYLVYIGLWADHAESVYVIQWQIREPEQNVFRARLSLNKKNCPIGNAKTRWPVLHVTTASNQHPGPEVGVGGNRIGILP